MVVSPWHSISESRGPESRGPIMVLLLRLLSDPYEAAAMFDPGHSQVNGRCGIGTHIHTFLDMLQTAVTYNGSGNTYPPSRTPGIITQASASSEIRYTGLQLTLQGPKYNELACLINCVTIDYYCKASLCFTLEKHQEDIEQHRHDMIYVLKTS